MSGKTTCSQYWQTGIDKVLYHHHGNRTVRMQLRCWTYLSLWKPFPWCSWWLVHGQVSCNPGPPALPHCMHACTDTEKKRHGHVSTSSHNRCAWFKSDTMHPVTYLQVTWFAYSHIAKEKKESHCMMAWNWAPSYTPVHTNTPTYLPVAWQRLNLWLLSNGQCVRQWSHFCLGLSLRVYRALSPQCVSTICSKMMTKINTHTAVLSHNCIPNPAEADFRPRDTVNALTAARNFFFPRIQELGSDQPAERANFRADVSRCDMTGGLKKATARFHTLVELVIPRSHHLRQNKSRYLYLSKYRKCPVVNTVNSRG